MLLNFLQATLQISSITIVGSVNKNNLRKTVRETRKLFCVVVVLTVFVELSVQRTGADAEDLGGFLAIAGSHL